MKLSNCPLIFLASIIPFTASAADSPDKTDPAKEKSAFEKLADANFSLHRAFSGKEAGEPASFGFVDNIGESTTYSADFLLSYHSDAHYGSPGDRLTQWWQLSTEGHLSSDDEASQNSWTFRGGWAGDYGLGRYNEASIYNELLYISLNAKYETDRDFNGSKLTGELLLTPTLPAFFIGGRPDRSGPANNTPRPFSFNWRPFLGIDAGGTPDEGDLALKEKEDTIFRIRPKVRAEMNFDAAAKILGIHQVTLSTEYEYFFLPLEDDRTHGYFLSALNFELSDHVGLAFTYTEGESAPAFVDEHTFSGAVTVSF